MNRKRLHELEMGDGELTKEERDEGWHFCVDWDGMLLGPTSPENESCYCDVEVDGE